MEFGASAVKQLAAIRRTRLYDLAAAAPLIAWYLYCAAQLLPSVNQQVALVILFLRTDPSVLPATLLLSTLSHICTLLFFAVLVILFSIRRVPQLTTAGFYPRCVALIGTFLGVSILLLSPQELSWWPYLASLLLLIGGTAFAIYASLGLGRSISVVPQARRLVTSGPYKTIRHPLYFGEIVAFAGVTLQYFSVLAFLLLILFFLVQHRRMINEERILSAAFPEYADYSARTFRVVPGLY
jgi:protein-S-isoprenylcysteine O-methyltransferase Ste14